MASFLQSQGTNQRQYLGLAAWWSFVPTAVAAGRGERMSSRDFAASTEVITAQSNALEDGGAMRLMRKMTRPFVLSAVLAALAVLVSLVVPFASAEVSVSAGSVSGTVTDPQGAAVPNAKVTISNKDTGISQTLATSDSGTFTSGALAPATYVVRVEAKNFKTYQTTLAVQVGQISTANARLEIGDSTSVIAVTGSAIQINSEQAHA